MAQFLLPTTQSAPRPSISNNLALLVAFSDYSAQMGLALYGTCRCWRPWFAWLLWGKASLSVKTIWCYFYMVIDLYKYLLYFLLSMYVWFCTLKDFRCLFLIYISKLLVNYHKLIYEKNGLNLYKFFDDDHDNNNKINKIRKEETCCRSFYFASYDDDGSNIIKEACHCCSS